MDAERPRAQRAEIAFAKLFSWDRKVKEFSACMTREQATEILRAGDYGCKRPVFICLHKDAAPDEDWRPLGTVSFHERDQATFRVGA